MLQFLKTLIQQQPSRNASDASLSAVELKRLDQRFLSQLKFLADKLPYPAWVRDRNCNLLYCNFAYVDALEVEVQHALEVGVELGQGVLGEDGKELARRALATEVMQSESHFVVSRGKRRLFEFTEVPLIDGSGLAGYAQDFTGIQDMQAELERHITANHEILEYLGTAIAMFGSDKRLHFYNAAFSRLWKLEEEYLSREPTYGEYLDKLRAERRLPEYADFPAFKKNQDAMFQRLLEPKQEIIHLPDERTLKLITIPHPLGGLMFSYEDVTDRIALERSYQTLHAVQQATLDNLYEGIAVFGSDGKLRLSNPAAGKMWQAPLEQLVGKEANLSEVLEHVKGFFCNDRNAKLWPKIKARLLSTFHERRVRSGRLKRTDRSLIDYTLLPLPDGATMISFLDATAVANVERALIERNEALEKADRVKSEFIAHVSYELRTPLTAIMGFSELLQQPDTGALTIKQKEYVQHISHATVQLQRLIDNLLDLASIEAGYISLNKKPTAVKPLLDAEIEFLQERLTAKQLNISVNCPDHVGEVNLDAQRFRQILANILSNSIKFTPKGGSVQVSASRDTAKLYITIKDTGVGIPLEDQQRLFHKFERAGNTTRFGSGSGLGLALVKQYVDLHHGSVQLESAPGKGTVVTVVLPV